MRAVGPLFTMLANAVTYGASAVLLLRIADVPDDRPGERTSLRADLREGWSWVYRHRILAPYALSLHLWFVGSSVAGTVFVFHASNLGLDATVIGLTLALAGLAGIVGAATAERVSKVIGTGRTIVIADLITGAAWFVAATASSDQAYLILGVSQSLFGFGLGLRGPLEMSLRNALTPSRLRGRMNTTIRSINWGLISIAAPLGGLIALEFGSAAALAFAGLLMLIAGLALLASPFRSA